MLDITLLPSAKVPLIYPDTNGMTTEWYRFFWNVYGFTGDSTGAVPVSKGGTGLTSIGNHQLIIGNSAGVFERTELVGSGITITYGAGTVTLAIGNSGVTPGTYGSASSVGQFVVDVHGTLTFAQNIPIAIAASQITSGELPILHGGTGASTAAGARANLSAAILGANNDITSMTGITGGISTPQFIQMDDGNSQTLAAGKLWYTPNTGAWNLGMGNGNITQQIGEELFIYGKASAAITDSPLQIIYHTGTVGASGVIKFAPTVAGITDENAIIGVATENIALNGFGRITSFGVIHGINTTGSAFGETWADDDVIWYNPVTGNPTKVKPSAPNIKFQIGIVITAGSGGSGSFQVLLQPGTQLGGTDSNVQITSPANGNILTYDGTNAYWRNTVLTAGTGASISASATGTLTISATGTGGTVTSVAASVPSFLSISGSPITTSGTLAISYSGTALPTANGGTGLTSFTANGVVYASSTSALATSSRLTYSSGTLSLNLSTTKNTIAIGDNAIGTYSAIQTFGGNGQYNFQSGTGINVASAYEITPSTAVNGTTFSTPAFVVFGSGGVAVGSVADPGATNLRVNGTLGVSATPVNAKIQVTAANSLGISVTGSGYTTSPSGIGFGQYDSVTYYIQRPASSAIQFWKSDTTVQMQIGANGGVSIGNTTDPGAGNLSVTGSLTLGTALTTANGGTGLGGATPYTANGIVYASSTSALTTSSSLSFSSSILDVTGSVRATSEGAGINSAGQSVSVRRTTNDSVLYLGFRTTPDSWVIGASYASTGAYKPIAFATSDSERMRIFASGGVSIGNTTDPGAANLSVTGTIRTQGYTVATLPAAGTVGRKAYVTDALAPVFLGTLTGGGSVKCPVFDNGTAWVAG